MTNFNGTITGATDSLMHLSVAGPNHYHFSNSYRQSFNEPLNLSTGSYSVSMSATTDGSFEFNITGNVVSTDPKVPDKFTNTMHMYDLEIL
ncbi:MAG: hypothetical protein WBW71_10250 [Bacteroidota bacterium]